MGWHQKGIDQTYAKAAGPCRRCGAELVERANDNTKEHFLGCSQYPDCSMTMPIPEPEMFRRAGYAPLPGFE